MNEANQKAIKHLIETAEREIAIGTIMSDFYTAEATQMSKEDAAKTNLKSDQIKKNLAFNTRLLEYLKAL
jgi:TPP-dependent 2-oxoacid decarboxylase